MGCSLTHDEKPKNKKVYGSSSAFMQGSIVFTETPSGCLRNTLLQSRGVRDNNIDPCHIIRGAMNEEEFEKRLQAQGADYKREVPVQSPVAGFPSVTFSGRCDFIILDEQGNRRVIELKSTESKSRLKDIKSGFYKIYNLAQLVAYMIENRTTKGELIYTYYAKVGDQYKQEFESVLPVVVDDHGSIVVNNLPSGFTVHDQLLHRVNSAKVITEGIIWSRPHKWDVKWKSPCNFCAFKSACDRVDSGDIVDADTFAVEAQKLVTKENSNDNSN